MREGHPHGGVGRLIRFRALAAFVVLACCVALWPRPAAGALELKLNYWPVTTSGVPSGAYVTDGVVVAGGGNWNTQFFGGDLRWTSLQHWGIHLKYDTGSQGSWGGALSFLGLTTGGTDTVWSADVFYAWQVRTVTLRGFAGYGSIQYVFNYNPSQSYLGASGETLSSAGYRVGADAAIPIPNSHFALNASAAWYPSNTTTDSYPSPGSPTSGGSATDLSGSVQYTWPSGWLAELGYRWITWNTGSFHTGIALTCPCTFATNGPFFAVGHRW